MASVSIFLKKIYQKNCFKPTSTCIYFFKVKVARGRAYITKIERNFTYIMV